VAGELDFGSSTSNEAFSSSEFEINLREGLPLPSTLATFRDVAIPIPINQDISKGSHSLEINIKYEYNTINVDSFFSLNPNPSCFQR
jgi:hypothetical protein